MQLYTNSGSVSESASPCTDPPILSDRIPGGKTPLIMRLAVSLSASPRSFSGTVHAWSHAAFLGLATEIHPNCLDAKMPHSISVDPYAGPATSKQFLQSHTNPAGSAAIALRNSDAGSGGIFLAGSWWTGAFSYGVAGEWEAFLVWEESRKENPTEIP